MILVSGVGDWRRLGAGVVVYKALVAWPRHNVHTCTLCPALVVRPRSGQGDRESSDWEARRERVTQLGLEYPMPGHDPHVSTMKCTVDMTRFALKNIRRPSHHMDPR